MKRLVVAILAATAVLMLGGTASAGADTASASGGVITAKYFPYN